MIPSRHQWNHWSLPSKLTAIGTFLGASGILLATLFFVIPYFWPPKSTGKQLDELISILEFRANRIRNELQPYYKYTEISEFINRFNELHAKHIAALRSGDFALAHEELIEIHRLSANLESSEFWRRHNIEHPDTNYELGRRAFDRGPMISIYINGSFQSKGYPLPQEVISDNSESINETIKLYNKILNGGSINTNRNR